MANSDKGLFMKTPTIVKFGPPTECWERKQTDSSTRSSPLFIMLDILLVLAGLGQEPLPTGIRPLHALNGLFSLQTSLLPAIPPPLGRF